MGVGEAWAWAWASREGKGRGSEAVEEEDAQSAPRQGLLLLRAGCTPIEEVAEEAINGEDAMPDLEIIVVLDGASAQRVETKETPSV